MSEQELSYRDSASATRSHGSIAWLTALMAIAVFATSAYASLPHVPGMKWLSLYVPPFNGENKSELAHLGGEHRMVSEALRDGRGFADPFGDRTGPTAWVAPALPILQALLMTLVGIDRTVIAIVILQNMTLIFSGWLVVRGAAKCRWPHAPLVGALLFIAITWMCFSFCYQITHDAWLIMFMLGLQVYLAERLWATPLRRRTAVCWGLAGGAAMLSAPAFGPVWLVLSALLAGSARQARPLVVSVLVAAVVMAPWIVRNAIVFGRFIPVKSNLFFELDQSRVLARDGVLTLEGVANHPFTSSNTERTHYRLLGETAYLDEYRARSVEGIGRDPLGYLTQVKNRLLAATLVYHPFNGREGTRHVLVHRLLHPLPFLGLAIVVMTRGWMRDPLKLIAIVVYVTYLVPYVLVSYYRRYAIPTLGLQVMLEIWALDTIRGWLIDLVRDRSSRARMAAYSAAPSTAD